MKISHLGLSWVLWAVPAGGCVIMQGETDTTPETMSAGSETDATTNDMGTTSEGSETAVPTTGDEVETETETDTETVPTTGDVPEELHECEPYRPADVSGERNGSFTEIDEFETWPIVIDDPGGGLVTVTLQASGGTTVSVLIKDVVAEVNSHIGHLTDENGNAKIVFRAHGNKTYNLSATAFVTPNDVATWTAKWSYEPLVDCYEHNDTRADARAIPVNTPISAYAHTGILEEDGVLVGPSVVDWYRFTIHEPATVSLASVMPDESALFFDLLGDDDIVALATASHVAAPNSVESEAVELAAGTYYVRLGYFVSDSVGVSGDDVVPALWREPYTLTVNVTP